MTLLKIRKQYGLSQIETSSFLGMPIRTYIRYEKNDNYGDSLKRKMMINSINDKFEITETKGVVSINQIKEVIADIISRHYKDKIEFCYLFGSYAKGYATEKSDIDLCISTSLTGLDFIGIIEEFRAALHKKIDLLRLDSLKDNIEVINEIMKDGIKIYG